MRVLSIIVGVLLVIGGIYCVLTPGLTFLSIGWLIGLLLLIAGMNTIADYFALRKIGFARGGDLFFGILTGILGLVLLFNQPARFLTDAVAVYLLGIWVVVSGVINIATSLSIRKAAGGWVWLMVLGILQIVLGVYAFFHPVVSAIALSWLIGFFIIIEGVNLITMGASMSSSIDDATDTDWTTSR